MATPLSVVCEVSAPPQISASAVAASIGKHPYQDADSAMLRVLLRDPLWSGVVEELKMEHRLSTPTEALEDACIKVQSLSSIVKTGVAAAVGAKTDADMSDIVQRTVADAVACLPPDLAKPDVIAATVTQAINMSRGNKLENVALDEFETAHGASVTERNARKMCLDARDYVIWGRIDGYDAATHTVVEAKNRMRKWSSVPSYDIIQLRVYLKMASQHAPTPPRGTLLERFPDGTTRTTTVEHDEAEWAKLHADIMDRVVTPFKAMTRERVLEILRSSCVTKTK